MVKIINANGTMINNKNNDAKCIKAINKSNDTNSIMVSSNTMTKCSKVRYFTADKDIYKNQNSTTE